jgi:hypothetical protein
VAQIVKWECDNPNCTTQVDTEEQLNSITIKGVEMKICDKCLDRVLKNFQPREPKTAE